MGVRVRPKCSSDVHKPRESLKRFTAVEREVYLYTSVRVRLKRITLKYLLSISESGKRTMRHHWLELCYSRNIGLND